MKFDVVIGNPPYNKGMDLDFVDLGYKISNKYTVMITPRGREHLRKCRVGNRLCK